MTAKPDYIHMRMKIGILDIDDVGQQFRPDFVSCNQENKDDKANKLLINRRQRSFTTSLESLSMLATLLADSTTLKRRNGFRTLTS